MAEKTDEQIKKKRKEFIEDIETTVNTTGTMGMQLSPAVSKLEQFAQKTRGIVAKKA